MLNLYKLEIFAVVAQVGSFNRAADYLYMTQPAISQHIQALEAALGTSLFERSPRGVSLTAAGETLYDYARRILQLVAEAENVVANVEKLDGAQISIGSTPGVSVYLLPGWLHTFRARLPNIIVSVQTGITSQVADGVVNRRLDLGLVEGELEDYHAPGLGQIVLREIELQLVVGEQHEWRTLEAVPPAALHQQPFIMRQRGSDTYAWTLELFRKHAMQPHIVAELDNTEAIKRAVMSGMGMTILPDYVIDSGLHALRIDGVTLRRSIKLLWNRDIPCTPLTKALLAHLSQDFPHLLTIANRFQPVAAS